MLEAMVDAAQQLFTPGPMIAFALMIPVALIAGLMPGGGLPFIVVVLSFTTELEPFTAMALIIGYMAANDLTEPIPSILLGIPGARSSQATILDGYPMAKKGQAGIAIGASYTASLLGGVIGAIALLAVLPFARELLKLFGAPEFFLLSLLGIASVGIISAGAISKGLLTAALGLFIGMIGFNDIVGATRATFDIDYLWDGIDIIPVVVGLFAFPEVADLVISNTPVAKERMEEMLKEGGTLLILQIVQPPCAPGNRLHELRRASRPAPAAWNRLVLRKDLPMAANRRREHSGRHSGRTLRRHRGGFR